MNNDLISREALIKAVEDLYEYAELDEVLEVIKNAPTIDNVINVYPNGEVIVQEKRPHGEWIRTTHDTKGEHPQTACWYKCSVCNKDNPVNIMFKYCPNCGADMQEEGGK